MTQITGKQAAQSAAKWGLITWFAITAFGALAGYVINRTSGLWGSALGALVAGLFFAVTAIVAVQTTSLGPDKLGAVILGSWLIKIVLLMAALAWLRGQDFYSRPFFFVVLLAQTMVLLVLEAVLLTKAKVPYVEPDR